MRECGLKGRVRIVVEEMQRDSCVPVVATSGIQGENMEIEVASG